MNAKIDVLIIGSGPVGLANACLMKCLNNKLNVLVVDKRPDTTRKHGLKIDRDTSKKMNMLLKKALSENPDQEEFIRDLQSTFKKWGGNVVRTNDIEDQLQAKAEAMGIRILREKEYTVSPENFQKGFKDEYIKKYLDEAEVIIGADGSHSVVREAIMHNEIEQEKNLSYLIEFKYQTPRITKRRNNWQAFKLSLKTGSVDFETMGRGNKGRQSKPATLHVNVKKNIYDQFRPTDESGAPTKGTFQNSWSESEIREEAENNPEIAKVLKTFDAYKKDVESRGGACENLKITAIPMNVYRSKKVAAKHRHRYVLLCGDASSGVVFGRGVNKGFQEAVICAQSVDQYFKSKKAYLSEMPRAFETYEKKQAKLFKAEKNTAMLKARGVKLSEVAFSAMAKTRRFFKNIFTRSKHHSNEG